MLARKTKCKADLRTVDNRRFRPGLSLADTRNAKLWRLEMLSPCPIYCKLFRLFRSTSFLIPTRFVFLLKQSSDVTREAALWACAQHVIGEKLLRCFQTEGTTINIWLSQANIKTCQIYFLPSPRKLPYLCILLHFFKYSRPNSFLAKTCNAMQSLVLQQLKNQVWEHNPLKWPPWCSWYSAWW